MHRKLNLFRYLSILLLLYASFLVSYINNGAGISSMFLLIIEDFLLPVGAFSLGVKFEKRKLVWLLIFVFIGVFSRIIGNGDLSEIGLSVLILFPYIIGGYFYRKSQSKIQLFVGLIFVNLIILMIPSISVPLYISIMEQKVGLISRISEFSGIKQTVSMWLFQGIEYWSYGVEVFEKIIIGFFVVRVHNSLVKRTDYSLNISFFHRKYGSIVLVVFMLILILKLLGYNGIMQYSLVLFSIYLFFTGAIEIFAAGRFAKLFRRSFIRQIFPYIWLGSMMFASFEISFFTAVFTIIYSAYISTIGKHNITKLVNDTIKRIKGD